MGSRFSALFSGRVAAAHENQFAQSVSVTTNGTTVVTPAVCHLVKIQTRTTNLGEIRVALRRVRFTLLTTIADNAIVTIDGEDWSIEDRLASIESGCEVNLVRTLASEVSRMGLRR